MFRCRDVILSRITMMLMLAFALFGFTSSALGQALNTTFETEGNAYDQAALSGTDWDTLDYYDSLGLPLPAGFDVYTGVIQDFGAGDTTRFGVGSKDIQDIDDWAWQALPPNDKVDITNGQATLVTPAFNKTFLYMEADRFSNDGDAAMGLWLLQDSTVNYVFDTVSNKRVFTGQHVAGTPGPGGPIGDILILAHYTKGGAVDSIAIYEWVGSGGNTDSLFGNEGHDAFDLIPKDSTKAFGEVNQDTTFAPWPYTPKSGTSGIFPFASFFEGALDLGQLLGTVPCFAKVLFETRESQSLKASTKDFLLGVFSTFPIVSVNSDTVCEGDTGQLCAVVQPGTGVAPFHYSWSTGDTTSCISVSTAGTYWVVVTGDNGCPSDTVYGTLVTIPPPPCFVDGPDSLCPLDTNQYCGQAGLDIYSWSISGNGSIVGSTTGQCVDVATGSSCGPYTLYLTVGQITGNDTCYNNCADTFLVYDVTPPVLSCPNDTTFDCVAGNPGVATATDNCDSAVVTFEDDTTSLRCPIIVSRKWIATDLCNNVDSCRQTIVVQDTTNPVLSSPNDTTFECVMGNPGTATATDNCDSVVVTYSDSTISARCPIIIDRTWVATDTCDNSVSDVQRITVQDTIPPTLTCPANDTIPCSGTVVFGTPDADDNCDPSPDIDIVFESTVGPVLGVTTYTRCWVATDSCGNKSDTCCQTITEKCPTGKIAPTQATCQDFLNGTTGDITEICYGKKKGLVNNTAPGVFFYYTKVTAPSASFTVDIVQTRSATTFPFFDVQNLDQVRLFDGNCNTLPISFTDGGGQAHVNISGAYAGQIFIISVKYQTNSIVGTSITGNPTQDYDFHTEIGGVTVDADADGLTLRNCVGGATAAGLEGNSSVAKLDANYPNPFNATTTIRYSLPQNANVELTVFNILGQKVRTLVEGEQSAGEHIAIWDSNNEQGRAVASGVYFYRLRIGDEVLVKRMSLLK